RAGPRATGRGPCARDDRDAGGVDAAAAQPSGDPDVTVLDRDERYGWSAFADIESLLGARLRTGEFRPVCVTEVELTHGLHDLHRRLTDSGEHDLALVLVRLHDQPLGLARLDVRVLDARRQWPAAVRAVAGDALAEHLAADAAAAAPGADDVP